MIERYQYKQITWIDLLNPTTEEIREVIKECDISPELGTDLANMTPHSVAAATSSVLKVTLDFPIVKRTDINHPHEVKFLATKTHLITVHFEEIEALDRFRKEFEVSSMLTKNSKSVTGAHLLLTLLLTLYHNMTSKLDYLEQKMLAIEEGIFAEKEKEMVPEISTLKRRLLTFRQTLHAHQPVLESLHELIPASYGKKLTSRMETIRQEHQHQLHRAIMLFDTTEELRDTNHALLSAKQNEIMKLFTILAFVAFPLSLFASLFNMRTVATPIIGHPADFWIILTIMAIVSLMCLMYFRYKKWL